VGKAEDKFETIGEGGDVGMNGDIDGGIDVTIDDGIVEGKVEVIKDGIVESTITGFEVPKPV